MNLLKLFLLLTAFISTVQFQTPIVPDLTIAFSNGQDLYITNFKDEPTQLTNEGTYNILPTWSADGQQLAYLSASSYEDTSRQAHLMTMNVTTREVKQISSLELTSETNLAWSPDGKHIAVTLGALFVVDLETEETHALSVDHISAQGPSWSPDSTRIAFSANSDVYVIYADGHDIQKLSMTFPYSYQPQWSHAANQILFITNKENTVGINTADGESYAFMQLLEFQNNAIFKPQWSADGKQIAFTLSGENSSEHPVTDLDDIYVLNTDGTELHAVSSKGIDTLIGWISDNKHVLYQSGEPGGAAVSIFIANVDNGKTTKLSNNTLEQMCAYGNCQSISIRPDLGAN